MTDTPRFDPSEPLRTEKNRSPEFIANPRDRLNAERARRGRSVLGPTDYDERCSCVVLYRDGTPEERAYAIKRLREIDAPPGTTPEAYQGMPPGILRQLAAITGRTLDAAPAPPDTNDGGTP